MASRVEVTIRTVDREGEEFCLALNVPRGEWSLADLHEMARTAGESAAIITEYHTKITVDVEFKP